MPRTLALRCSDCRRPFGGDETLKRHRFLSGDRYRCLSDRELIERGFRQDPKDRVWRRPRLDQLTLPSLSVAPVADSDPTLLVRRSDPGTSVVAARTVAPRTGTTKAAILGVYADSDQALTDREVAHRLGMEAWQVSKRVSDLIRDRLVEATGVRDGERGVKVRVCRAVTEQAAS